MSVAAIAAFTAAVAGVLAAWELSSAVEASGLREAVAGPLRRAGVEGRAPSAPERRRLVLVCAGALLAAGWLVAGPAAAVAACLCAPAASTAAVRAARRRYAGHVRRGAAPAARALAAAVGSGRSVRSAIEEAAAGLDGPVARELGTAARALALGDRTDAVLERLRIRAGGRAWDTLVAALLIQRRAGGDLAGLLRDLATSLEASARAEQDARTATAQARASARIVLAMPIVAAGLTELTAPGFVLGLLAHPVAAVLAGLAGALQVAAVLSIRRLTRLPAP